MSKLPPPLPDPSKPPVMGYHAPAAPQRSPNDSSQRVFDTVVGPNVRLKDNLIQLACVVVGGGAGALIGNHYWAQTGLALGAIFGLIGALIVSGAVIGVIRLFRR